MSKITLRYSIPGIGGSLGECVVCGDNFLPEILLGQSIKMMSSESIEADLPVHFKCFDLVDAISKSDKDWHRLPEGPLRRFYAEWDAAREERKKDETRTHDGQGSTNGVD